MSEWLRISLFLICAILVLVCAASFLRQHSYYRDGIFHKIYNYFLYIGLKVQAVMAKGADALHHRAERVFGTYQPDRDTQATAARREKQLHNLKSQMDSSGKAYSRKYNLKVLK